MRNLVIGTAGHIDHGKTSLIKALTGINTDTLKEEQTRGITVNLGFAYLKLDEGQTVGIVDVPGHERLIKNMLAGVCGIDLILLTIAADDGIMPQTREHMEIINFLHVKNIIVVLTKVDLVTKERIEEVKQLIREEFNLNTFVEFSIYQEESTHHVIQAIKDNINTDVKVIEEPFRMPIDRVFTVKGQGVVITGSSLSGMVKVGDELEILPTKQRVRVRGIQSFNQPRQEAYKRMRVALNLGGVKKEDIKRGKIIATKDTFSPSEILDVKITTSRDLQEPIKNLEEVKFYYLASELKCRVKLINKKEIGANEIVYGQLLLDEPIYASNKDLGVLRRVNPIKTIAGVEVINVFGEYVNRKDESYIKTLELFEQEHLDELMKQYINQHPFIKLNEMKQRLNLTAYSDEEITQIILNHGILFDDGASLTHEKLSVLKQNVIDLLTTYHQNNPLEIGINKQICQHELGLKHVSNKSYNQFLNSIDEIKIVQDKVKLASFTIKYNKEEQKVVDDLLHYIDISGFNPPKLDDLIQNVRGKDVKSLYYSLIKEQELIKIEQDIVLTKQRYDEMIHLLDDYFKSHEILMIKDARDLLNTSRKFIVAYLEYLDKIGYTRRIDEGRIKK